MNYCVSDILNEASAKRKGHLGTLNLALLAYGCIAISLAIPSMIIKVVGGEAGVSLVGTLFFDLVMSPLLLYPILVGLLCLGVDRARDGEIRVKSIFGHYNKMWSLYAAFIICVIFYTVFGILIAVAIALLSSAPTTTALIGLIIALAVLFAVYVGYLTSFVWLLIVDKGLGTISAYKHSVRTVWQRRNFWLLFKLTLMYTIWVSLGAFTLGIAYFWIIPRFIIAYGIVYRDLFDVEPEVSMTGGKMDATV